MSVKANLRNLLAEGNTREVLEQLKHLTNSDIDLQEDAISLSARYQKYLREKHRNTLDTQSLDMELNRINAAILNLIEKLPIDSPFAKKKWSWERIALILGIFAAVAGITGYTMKDFFFPTQDAQQVIQPPPPDTTTVMQPETKESVPAGEPTTTIDQSKNKVNVEINDQGKVGNIITGDSNTIEIKQEF
jgi:hypothetical protein